MAAILTQDEIDALLEVVEEPIIADITVLNFIGDLEDTIKKLCGEKEVFKIVSDNNFFSENILFKMKDFGYILIEKEFIIHFVNLLLTESNENTELNNDYLEGVREILRNVWDTEVEIVNDLEGNNEDYNIYSFKDINGYIITILRPKIKTQKTVSSNLEFEVKGNNEKILVEFDLENFKKFLEIVENFK